MLYELYGHSTKVVNVHHPFGGAGTALEACMSRNFSYGSWCSHSERGIGGPMQHFEIESPKIALLIISLKILLNICVYLSKSALLWPV